MSVEFHRDWPLADLTPADYNPRRITPDAFEELQKSLRRFGVVKPVILNRDGTVVAGHQRTRAMRSLGMKTTPALLLDKTAELSDEIQFNMLHNSVETEGAYVQLNPEAFGGRTGYLEVPFDAVTFEKGELRGPVVKELCSMVGRYGPWGSVVAAPTGEVIANSDYALACHMMRQPVLVYVAEAEDVPGLVQTLAKDFGEYDYEALDVKSYSSTHAQMYRLRGERGADGELVDHSRDNTSRLYETVVLPYLQTLEQKPRIVDFVAGQCDYATMLAGKGYPTTAYEPHFRPDGRPAIDPKHVAASVVKLGRRVDREGLYPVVVLDSVLNSVTSLDWRHKVMVCVNALCASDGVVGLATRRLGAVVAKSNMTKTTVNDLSLKFLDRNGFHARYRYGKWTLQLFHSPEQLQELLSLYFGDVQVDKKTDAKGQIFAVCHDPLPLGEDEYRAALDAELNMPMPGGFQHNRQGPAVEAIVARALARDAARSRWDESRRRLVLSDLEGF